MTNKPSNSRAFFAQGLEARMLLDAAAAASLDEAIDDAAAQSTEDVAQSEGEDFVSDSDSLARAAVSLTDNLSKNTGRQVVVIDSSIADNLDLFESFDPNIEVLVVDNLGNSLELIADTLDEGGPVSAVHIFSHGDDGVLKLGGQIIDFTNLDSEQSKQLMRMSEYFTADGDILIYGCDFAATEKGEAAVASIAALTGADVAASEDATGDETLGGDWDLEHEFGIIEAANPFVDFDNIGLDELLGFAVNGKEATIWLDAADHHSLINSGNNTLADDPTNTNIRKIDNKGSAGGQASVGSGTAHATTKDYTANGQTYANQRALTLSNSHILIENAGYVVGSMYTTLSTNIESSSSSTANALFIRNYNRSSGAEYLSTYVENSRITTRFGGDNSWGQTGDHLVTHSTNINRSTNWSNVHASTWHVDGFLYSSNHGNLAQQNYLSLGYTSLRGNYSDSWLTAGYKWNSEVLNLDFYDLIHLNNRLNTAEQRSVQAYLNAKRGWGGFGSEGIERGYEYGSILLTDFSGQRVNQMEVDELRITNIDFLKTGRNFQISNNNERGTNVSDNRVAEGWSRSEKVWRVNHAITDAGNLGKVRLEFDLEDLGFAHLKDSAKIGITETAAGSFQDIAGTRQLNGNILSYEVDVSDLDNGAYMTLMVEPNISITRNSTAEIMADTSAATANVLDSFNLRDSYRLPEESGGTIIEVTRSNGANPADIWSIDNAAAHPIASITSTNGVLRLEMTADATLAQTQAALRDVNYTSTAAGRHNFTITATSGVGANKTANADFEITVVEEISERPSVTTQQATGVFNTGRASVFDAQLNITDRDSTVFKVVLEVASGTLHTQTDTGLTYPEGLQFNNRLVIQGTQANINQALSQLTINSAATDNQLLNIEVTDDGGMAADPITMTLLHNDPHSLQGLATPVTEPYRNNEVRVRLGNPNASFTDPDGAGETYRLEVSRSPAGNAADRFETAFGNSQNGILSLDLTMAEINQLAKNLELINNDPATTGTFNVSWSITDSTGIEIFANQVVTIESGQAAGLPEVTRATKTSDGQIAQNETFTFEVVASENISKNATNVTMQFTVGAGNDNRPQTATLSDISDDSNTLTFVASIADDNLTGAYVTLKAGTISAGAQDADNNKLTLISDIRLDDANIDTTETDAIAIVGDPTASTSENDAIANAGEQVTITLNFDEPVMTSQDLQLEIALDDGKTGLANINHANTASTQITFVYNVQLGDNAPNITLGNLVTSNGNAVFSVDSNGQADDVISNSATNGLVINSVAIDGNLAPTGATLTPNDYIPSNTAGVTIGTLAATDPDTPFGDTTSMSVIGVTGTRLAADAFIIDGGTIRLAPTASLDKFDGTAISLTIRVTDQAGEFIDQTVQFNIDAINLAPEVTPQQATGGFNTGQPSIFDAQLNISDQDSTVFTVILEADNGILQTQTNAGLDYPEGQQSGNRLVIRGTQANINQALSQLTINSTATANQTLNITVADAEGAAADPITMTLVRNNPHILAGLVAPVTEPYRNEEVRVRLGNPNASFTDPDGAGETYRLEVSRFPAGNPADRFETAFGNSQNGILSLDLTMAEINQLAKNLELINNDPATAGTFTVNWSITDSTGLETSNDQIVTIESGQAGGLPEVTRATKVSEGQIAQNETFTFEVVASEAISNNATGATDVTMQFTVGAGNDGRPQTATLSDISDDSNTLTFVATIGDDNLTGSYITLKAGTISAGAQDADNNKLKLVSDIRLDDANIDTTETDAIAIVGDPTASTSENDAIANAGEQVTITLNFDEPVMTSQDLQLEIALDGGKTGLANVSRADAASTQITFVYDVQLADNADNITLGNLVTSTGNAIFSVDAAGQAEDAIANSATNGIVIDSVAIDGNVAPTGAMLTANDNIPSNTAGVTIGTITATDPNTPFGDTTSMSVIGVAGSKLAADAFIIDGNTLRLAPTASLDKFDGTAISLTVRVIDQGGEFIDQVVRFNIDAINLAPEATPQQDTGIFNTGQATTFDAQLNISDPDSNIFTVILEVDNGTLQTQTNAGLDHPEGQQLGNRLVIRGTQADLNAALSGLTINSTATANQLLNITVADAEGAAADPITMTLVRNNPHSLEGLVTPATEPYRNAEVRIQLGNPNASFTDPDGADETYRLEVSRFPAGNPADRFETIHGNSQNGVLSLDLTMAQINQLAKNLELINNDPATAGTFNVNWSITDSNGLETSNDQLVTIESGQAGGLPEVTRATKVSEGQIAQNETFTFEIVASEAISNNATGATDITMQFTVGAGNDNRPQTATLSDISDDSNTLTFVSTIGDDNLTGSYITLKAGTISAGAQDADNNKLTLVSDIRLDDANIDTTETDAIAIITDPTASTSENDAIANAGEQVTITLNFDEPVMTTQDLQLEIALDDGKTGLANISGPDVARTQITFVYNVQLGDNAANITLGNLVTSNGNAVFSVDADGQVDDVIANSATSGLVIDSVAIDGNVAPTGVTLTANNNIPSNTAGVAIGTLAATDRDTPFGDTTSMSVIGVTGTKLTADAFIIDGNAIRLAPTASLDKFDGTTVSLTIRVTDQAGEFIDQTVQFSIEATNLAPEVTTQQATGGFNTGQASIIDAQLDISDRDSTIFTVVLTVDNGTLQTQTNAGLDYPEGRQLDNRLVIRGTQANINQALSQLIVNSTATDNQLLNIAVADAEGAAAEPVTMTLVRNNPHSLEGLATPEAEPYRNEEVRVRLGNPNASFSDPDGADETYRLEVSRFPAGNPADRFETAFGNSQNGILSLDLTMAQINQLAKSLELINDDPATAGTFNVNWSITDSTGLETSNDQLVTIESGQAAGLPEVIKATKISEGQIAQNETFTFEIVASEAISKNATDVTMQFTVGEGNDDRPQTATLSEISDDSNTLTFVASIDNGDLTGSYVTLKAGTISAGAQDADNNKLKLTADVRLNDANIDSTETDAIAIVGDPTASTSEGDDVANTGEQVTITLNFDEPVMASGDLQLEIALDDGKTGLAKVSAADAASTQITFVYDAKFGDNADNIILGNLVTQNGNAIFSVDADGQAEDVISNSATDGLVINNIAIDGNIAPTGATLTANDYIPSNTAGITIGTIVANDPDARFGDTTSMSIIGVTGTKLPADAFMIDGDTIRLDPAASLNKFDGTAVSLIIRVTDKAGEFVDQTIQFDVDAINLAPEAVANANVTISKYASKDLSIDLEDLTSKMFTDPDNDTLQITSVSGLPAGLSLDVGTQRIVGKTAFEGELIISLTAFDGKDGYATNDFVLELKKTAPVVVVSGENKGAALEEVERINEVHEKERGSFNTFRAERAEYQAADPTLPSMYGEIRIKQIDQRAAHRSGRSYTEATNHVFDMVLKDIQFKNADLSQSNILQVIKNDNQRADEASSRFRNHMMLSELTNPVGRNPVDDVRAIGAHDTSISTDINTFPIDIKTTNLLTTLRNFDTLLDTTNLALVRAQLEREPATRRERQGIEPLERKRLLSELRTRADELNAQA